MWTVSEAERRFPEVAPGDEGRPVAEVVAEVEAAKAEEDRLAREWHRRRTPAPYRPGRFGSSSYTAAAMRRPRRKGVPGEGH